jgi:hypothetical protein
MISLFRTEVVNMRKWFIPLAALALTGSAAASEPTPAGNVGIQGQEVAAPKGESTNLLSLEGGVDFTTAYFYRGYNTEDQGLIAQPYATLSFNIPALQDVGGFKVTPYVGSWNSLHSKDGPESPKWFNESDFIAGVNAERGIFTLGLVYTYQSFPSGSFNDGDEIGVTLKVDDTGVMPVALHPHVGVYRELNHSLTYDATRSPGWYGEVGIEPASDVKALGRDVTISFPVTVGLSLDGYYTDSGGDNDLLGYGSAGVKVSLPLNDAVSVYVAGTYLYLFADSAEAANHGENYEIIGSAGISFSF